MRAEVLALACAAAQLASSMVAHAQTSTGSAEQNKPPTAANEPAADGDTGNHLLNEIVVTATRRPERLQDVALSITSLSQQELTARGIKGYEGLAHETPGVVLNRASANFNNFTARGI